MLKSGGDGGREAGREAADGAADSNDDLPASAACNSGLQSTFLPCVLRNYVLKDRQ